MRNASTEAGFDPRTDLDDVLLAGGASNSPFVREAVQHYFGRPPLHVADPEHLVAVGATVIAHDRARGAAAATGVGAARAT